jgi:hypothetical protein
VIDSLKSPFVFNDGTPVKTPADWPRRRQELIKTAAELQYGKLPPEPEFLEVEPLYKGQPGKLDTYRIRTGTREHQVWFTMIVYTTKAPGKRPVVISGDGCYGFMNDLKVARLFTDNGVILVKFNRTELAPDMPDPNRECGINALWPELNFSAISAWAWAASRVLDWMETEPLIDATHVGIVGHSRGGKTAIWTAVTDKRFAMACSNNSGCSGAKLNHIDLPRSEHIGQILKHFSYWFCPNYRSYIGKEMSMPFDQHELLALIAPRLLYVTSATRDSWAGPHGEWWAARLASPAWELYGKKGLAADTFPQPNRPSQEGSVAYHLRAGGHDLTPYDWMRFVDFAERLGWRK